MGVSVYWSLSMLCVCLCEFVWYQVRVPAKSHMCQTSVNLMPCCIKHASRSFWYWGTKVRHVWIHNIIKQNSTSNVAWSPIRSKKEDNRKSSGGGGWRRQGGVLNKILKRGGRQYREDLHKKGEGGLGPLCQLWMPLSFS